MIIIENIIATSCVIISFLGLLLLFFSVFGYFRENELEILRLMRESRQRINKEKITIGEPLEVPSATLMIGYSNKIPPNANKSS